MNNEIHTCDWFLDFFGAIPEDRWCVGSLTGFGETHCALGHCGATVVQLNYHESPMARALNLLFSNHLYSPVHRINDGWVTRYQQPTPKARILKALHDIKAKQEAAAEAFELRPLNLTKRAVERKEAVCS